MARDYRQADERADRRRQPAGSRAGYRHVPDQGRQISRGHAWLAPDGADQARAKLATYTASRAVYGDLTKMLCVLRARDALAKFDDALPATIPKFDDARVAKITALLDAFGKKHAEVDPLCAGAGGQAAQDSLATDPPRHQGRAQQERRGCRRHALCDRGLDGAGPAGRQAARRCALRSRTTGSSSPRKS